MRESFAPGTVSFKKFTGNRRHEVNIELGLRLGPGLALFLLFIYIYGVFEMLLLLYFCVEYFIC